MNNLRAPENVIVNNLLPDGSFPEHPAVVVGSDRSEIFFYITLLAMIFTLVFACSRGTEDRTRFMKDRIKMKETRGEGNDI